MKFVDFVSCIVWMIFICSVSVMLISVADKYEKEEKSRTDFIDKLMIEKGVKNGKWGSAGTGS